MFKLNVDIAYVSYSVRRGERVDRKKVSKLACRQDGKQAGMLRAENRMFEKIRGLRSSKNYNDKILSNPPPLLLV
jgi:hypothetical protein